MSQKEMRDMEKSCTLTTKWAILSPIYMASKPHIIKRRKIKLKPKRMKKRFNSKRPLQNEAIQ